VTATDDRAIQEEFRAAMRRVANTVTIVSVQSGAERHGTTATSVTSISMDPPSILICFNKTSRLHEFLTREDFFCVNVLHTDNFETSKAFSSAMTGQERFAHGNWQADASGIPYLADAQASLFCKKDKEISYGSHTIFIGRVIGVRARAEISPLLYRDGLYTSSSALEADLAAGGARKNRNGLD
jgi:flavin reductase (DIM6/NTAB) family NADH-FMN oxidoreductase RutF